MTTTLTKHRTYPGHAGILMVCPYVSEIRDPAAQLRWWDVFHFGYEDGYIAGRADLQAEQDAAAKADWERMEAARQAIARSKAIDFDALSELRGDHDRAEAIRTYWDQVNINRSPYRELKKAGFPIA